MIERLGEIMNQRAKAILASALVVVVALALVVGVDAELRLLRHIKASAAERADCIADLEALKAEVEALKERVTALEERTPLVPVYALSSWYGDREDGRYTASGDVFRPHHFTVAHRELPLGTALLIRNPFNNRVVPALVNDRGPYIDGRGLDVSQELAWRLGFQRQGLTELEYYVVHIPDEPFRWRDGKNSDD